MRSLRALLLLGLAATLASSPVLPQEKDWIKDVEGKITALQKAKSDFDSSYPSVGTELEPVIEDWQRGFDPATIQPKLASAKSKLESLKGRVTTVLNAALKYDKLKEEAKTKKIIDKPGVKDVLAKYEKALKALQEIVGLEPNTGSFSYTDHAGKWKILTQRIQDAGKVGSGSQGGEHLIVVGEKGLECCRVYGGEAKAWGAWWFKGGPPSSAKQARPKWALPPKNYCLQYVHVEFLEGAHLWESQNADLFGFNATGWQLRFDVQYHNTTELPDPKSPGKKIKSGDVKDWVRIITEGGAMKNQ